MIGARLINKIFNVEEEDQDPDEEPEDEEEYGIANGFSDEYDNKIDSVSAAKYYLENNFDISIFMDNYDYDRVRFARRFIEEEYDVSAVVYDDEEVDVDIVRLDWNIHIDIDLFLDAINDMILDYYVDHNDDILKINIYDATGEIGEAYEYTLHLDVKKDRPDPYIIDKINKYGYDDICFQTYKIDKISPPQDYDQSYIKILNKYHNMEKIEDIDEAISAIKNTDVLTINVDENSDINNLSLYPPAFLRMNYDVNMDYCHHDPNKMVELDNKYYMDLNLFLAAVDNILIDHYTEDSDNIVVIDLDSKYPDVHAVDNYTIVIYINDQTCYYNIVKNLQGYHHRETEIRCYRTEKEMMIDFVINDFGPFRYF